MPRDGDPERLEAIEALDAYWESLIAGARPLERSDEHAVGLARAVEHLYPIDDTPGVDPAFARDLEGRLMDRVQRPSVAGLTGGVPIPADRWWHRPGRQSDRQSEPRRSVGSLVATALLLLVTVTAGGVALRWGGEESSPTDSSLTVAPDTTPASTPSAQQLARSGPALALILADIFYMPPQLGIPPDTEVALTLANLGRTRHTFNVDALGIHVELQPGEMTTTILDAPAGTYEFYCSVPGHKEAGMVGTLAVDATYRLPVSLAVPPGNVIATAVPRATSPSVTP